jgi:DNA-binding response OmpR family regulator
MTMTRAPQDRIAELEEEVRQLRALLKPPLHQPSKWKLCKTEHDMLRAIAAGNGDFVSTLRIRAAVWRFADRDPVAVRVYVYAIRRKLKPHGVVIDSLPGFGYRIAKGLDELRGALQ